MKQLIVILTLVSFGIVSSTDLFGRAYLCSTYHRDLFGNARRILENYGLEWNSVERFGAGLPPEEFEMVKKVFSAKAAVVHILFAVNTVNQSLDLKSTSLDSVFETRLANMKHFEFEKRPKVFDEFIDLYGNGFFRHGTFGGMIVQRFITYEVDKFNRNPNLYIAPLVAKFKADLKLQPRETTKTSTESGHINWHSEETVVSGTRYYQDMAQFDSPKWLKSVSENPKLIGGLFTPLTVLIKDEFTKTQIDRAIWAQNSKIYLNQMTELIRLIDTQSEHLWKDSPELVRFDVDKILDRIERCRKQVVPSEIEVIQISDIVEPALEYIHGMKFLMFDINNKDRSEPGKCEPVDFDELKYIAEMVDNNIHLDISHWLSFYGSWFFECLFQYLFYIVIVYVISWYFYLR